MLITSFFIYIFLGIISIAFGLVCKIFISSLKIFRSIIGLYISFCIFLLITKASLIFIIPILLVLIGIFIGKNIINKKEEV